MRMRKLMLLVLLIISINAVGQKTRSEKILDRSMYKEFLSAYHYYDGDSITDTRIVFSGQNYKYQHITDIVTIYSGSPEDFYRFLNEVEAFLTEEEKGVMMPIMGRDCLVDFAWGTKYVIVYEEDSTNGHMLVLKSIQKFRKAFLQWCDEKSIDIS